MKNTVLIDKDLEAVSAAMMGAVDRWFACSLPGPRGASAERLRTAIRRTNAGAAIETCPDPVAAYSRAKEAAQYDDRIIVFGSFYTVSGVMQTEDVG